MPILRLRRDGSVLMGSHSPLAVANPEDLIRVKTLSDQEAEAQAIARKKEEAEAMKAQSLQIQEKILHQTLVQQARSQKILERMKEAASKEAHLQAARERNTILIAQLQSLVKGLGIALGLKKQETKANLPFPTDMGEEDDERLG